MSGDILDLIDNVLADPFTSRDAMRWNPEAGTTEAGCRNSADFSLAMLPPALVTGHISVYPAAVTPAVMGIEEGDVLFMDGRVMRVTRRTVLGDGSYSFELEAYEPDA